MPYLCCSRGADDDDSDGIDDVADAGYQEWRTLWIDEAFWHLLFAVDLLLVMIVCRPAINQCRSVIHQTQTVTHLHNHTQSPSSLLARNYRQKM